LRKLAMVIKNTDELTSHGFKEGRKAALEICEYAIRSANAIDSIKKLLNLKDHILEIDGLHLDLAKLNNVYVIGGGKATYSIGKAVEEKLPLSYEVFEQTIPKFMAASSLSTLEEFSK